VKVEHADGDLVASGALWCGCGATYAIADGIPDLVHPRGQGFILENADTYDRDLAFIAGLLDVDEHAARAETVSRLGLRSGTRVLEVACGPGPNLPHLLDRVGPSGSIHALDISPDMLRVARAKLESLHPGAPIEYLLGNGVHLPFADATFDAVLHMGTLNRFETPAAALAEMARVTRVGGRVIAADEGLAPWLRDTDYARVLAKFGGLFKGNVPIGAVPVTARDVSVRWLVGYAYFAIEFTVGTGEPRLNLDVRLPGRTVTVRDVLEATARRAP
jgi:SAM-dependent methyltransferase